MKEYNISEGFSNFSQRNNINDPANACGPTNIIQCLSYCGWPINPPIFKEFEQPEDKLLKFCRTDKRVLEFYKTNYKGLYDEWIEESERLAKEKKLKPWQVSCIKSYPPNEVHKVLNYAANLFIGFTQEDIAKRNVATWCVEYDNINDRCNLEDLLPKQIRDLKVPMMTSLRFKGGGHYVSIVGYTEENGNVRDVIVDNTYGRFNFKEEKYELVSGDDEKIPIKEFKDRMRPVMHFFKSQTITI